eukprot:3170586-Pleurochrysis_carterae.AAC.3
MRTHQYFASLASAASQMDDDVTARAVGLIKQVHAGHVCTHFAKPLRLSSFAKLCRFQFLLFAGVHGPAARAAEPAESPVVCAPHARAAAAA